MNILSIKEVIEQEKAQLRLRREKLGMAHGSPEQENWFGIALSGGGIRSATINLGFLKTLNKFGILQKADYLSTVSGGGYTHAYVQGTLKEEGDYSCLFTDEHIAAMRQHGEYLIPGKGIWKTGNTFLLAVAFVVSWLMSLVSPLLVAGIVYHIYMIVTGLLGKDPFKWLNFIGEHDLSWWALVGCGGLLWAHFLANIILNFNLGVSKMFNRVESLLVLLGLLFFGWYQLVHFGGVERISGDTITDYAINAVLLFCIGYFTNPNALSFHRFYRKQLADLFLRFSGAHDNTPLKDVFNAKSDKKTDYIAPYPLINTCLNLLNPDGDQVFKGTKTSDYFILSPLFCGSKLIGYVPTNRYWDYQRMTLPAAVTISAAAVNPGMGMYSNKILSVLMTVLNARLGFWISNPRILVKSRAFPWWPTYFFRELLGRIGSNNKMINISDGGHIENLGVYELLRRGCRLIVAVDAGEDKMYGFFDLNNLIIRARNELGLEIRFRHDEQPEELIRPRPTQVYSQKRYAVADILQWWADEKVIDPATQKESNQIVNFAEPRKIGTFIYVKSSVLAPIGKPVLSEAEDPLKFGTYKYKIYHPDFPHEPTSDQFFDEIQWEAYFQLGQYIGADVLGVTDLGQYDNAPAPEVSVEQLLGWFDNKENPLFVPFVPRGVRSPADHDSGLESIGGDEGPAASSAPPPTVAQKDIKYQM
jgi:hypothetical protein